MPFTVDPALFLLNIFKVDEEFAVKQISVSIAWSLLQAKQNMGEMGK